MDSKEAEQMVVAALEARSLRCEPFSKREMRAGKTPDRRVFQGDDLAFFLEIKEIEDVVTHGPGDSILDRIAARIHDAVAQFDAVNPDLEEPNVLAFVNRNQMCGTLDLVEVVIGHRLLEGGHTAPTGLRWSDGRIRKEKWRIHLWLWFDCQKGNGVFFNTVDRRHLDRLAIPFGVSPDSIVDVAVQHGEADGG